LRERRIGDLRERRIGDLRERRESAAERGVQHSAGGFLHTGGFFHTPDPQAPDLPASIAPAGTKGSVAAVTAAFATVTTLVGGTQSAQTRCRAVYAVLRACGTPCFRRGSRGAVSTQSEYSAMAQVSIAPAGTEGSVAAVTANTQSCACRTAVCAALRVP
jgi:hypothetical protein